LGRQHALPALDRVLGAIGFSHSSVPDRSFCAWETVTMTKPRPTNHEIAREFCAGAFQQTFGLSDEQTEEYTKVIAELLDLAVANANGEDTITEEK